MSGLIERIVILFSTSLAFGIAASTVKLPAIIGYMVAGTFLSLISGPESAKYLTGMGDIPLIILMFVAGLEFEITDFIKSSKKSIPFAFLQIGFVTLFVLFILILPASLPKIIMKNAQDVMIIAVPLFFIMIKGQFIQNFSSKNQEANILLRAIASIIYFSLLILSIKIYYSLKLLDAFHVFLNTIYLPIAILPFIYRLPYIRFRNALFAVIALFTLCHLSWLIYLYGTKDLTNIKIKILSTLISSLIVFFIPNYIEKAASLNKKIILVIIIVQAFLAGLSFIFPFFKAFLPLIATMKTAHIPVAIMTIGLLSLHSTAVSFRLIETKSVANSGDIDNGIVKSKPVIKSILIAQDILFVVFILILQGFKDSKSFVKLLPKILGAIFILYGAQRLSRAQPSFISSFLDYMREISSELITLFSLTFCLFCAYIGNLIGLSDLYGAFIAGLLLGNIYQRRKLVLACCEPICAVLMILFFVRIGLHLKFDYVVQNLHIISFINFFVILIKYVANYQSAKLVYKTNDEVCEETKFDTNCLVLMSMLMTQITEFFIIMIDIVKPAFIEDVAMQYFFDILESSCVVSLSAGCLITILFVKYGLPSRKKDVDADIKK